MKDSRVWRAGLLAGLLSLSWWSLAAEPVVPATGGEMETVSQVPEGYHPLPVTEFVVDAEKNDSYTITIGIEYLGKPSDAQEWLEKNITGKIDVYKINSPKPIYSYFIFNKINNYPNAGASGIVSNKTFWGEQFSVTMEKGGYMILPQLYFISNDSQFKPCVYISFKRVKPIWW